MFYHCCASGALLSLLGEATCIEFKALVPSLTYRYKKRIYPVSGDIILARAAVIFHTTISSLVDLTSQPWDAALHHIMEQTYLLEAKLHRLNKVNVQESQQIMQLDTRVHEIIESWLAALIASKKDHLMGQIAKMPICTV